MRTLSGIVSIFLLCAATTLRQDKISDLPSYYGFGDLEVIKLDWGINELLVTDFNKDGGNDIAVVNNRKARIELLIQKEKLGPEETQLSVTKDDIDINQINALTRFDKQSVPVSEKIFSLVSGDFNSDGLIDLSYYGEPKGLYILYQKTSEGESDKGRKLSWRTKKKINIETGLQSQGALASGDLNNDGLTDIALAGRDAVFILLQKDDGTLSEPVKYPTTARVLGLKICDLNGDKINDLVLATSDTEKVIHVRFGLKTGQLGPQKQFFIEKPYAMSLFNLDGRNGDEILTIDAMSGRLICYALKAAKVQDADWPILSYPLSAGEGSTKRDLVVADFDGDGLADITISDPGAAELVFYRQIEGLGLAEPVRFPALSDIDSMSVADIDGDARNELVVLSTKEKIIGVSEYENERLSFPKPIEVKGEPVAMALGDMNSDSKMDYLYISKDPNNLRTFRIIYNGINDPPVQKDPNAPAAPAASREFALKLPKLETNPEGIKVIDADQDGLKDVIIFVPYDEPKLLRQTQAGKFSLIDFPTAQSSLIKDASMRSTTTADVDGNRQQELLIAQKNFARSLVFDQGRSWKIIDQYNAKNTENEISAVGVFNIDGI
ncbi:MAG: VCBS repeat-containing protein, partial [Candidatus Brocadiia bacterium]